MTINGMNIKDIKDIHDVLAALMTIQAQIENSKEDLENLLQKNTDEKHDVRAIKEKEQQIIEAINVLMKRNKLFSETTEAKFKISNKILEETVQHLENGKKDLAITMDKGIKSLTAFRIRTEISEVLKIGLDAIESSVEKGTSEIRTKTKNLEKTSEDIERKIRSLNEHSLNIIEATGKIKWYIILTSFITGLFFGAFLVFFVYGKLQ